MHECVMSVGVRECVSVYIVRYFVIAYILYLHLGVCENTGWRHLWRSRVMFSVSKTAYLHIIIS